jgi:ComF family protein
MHTISLTLDFFLPKACCLCNAKGSLLCQQCQNVVYRHRSPSCTGCGLRQGCDCNTAGWAIDQTIALTDYEAPFDRLITALKFSGHIKIAAVLGEHMGLALAPWLENLPQPVALTPVPLSIRRFSERGFNQARQLAKAAQQTLNSRAAQANIQLHDYLLRQSATQAQALLDRNERLANLSGAYALANSKPKKQVVLIDDVMTTGATLNTCATLLKANGCETVWALVAARRQRT